MATQTFSCLKDLSLKMLAALRRKRIRIRVILLSVSP